MKIYLSNNLRFFRELDSISQVKMANKLGLKRATYSKYEEGLHEPNISTLLKISKHFDISLEVLLTKNIRKIK